MSYDDRGRYCTCCKEYKLWGEYSQHNKGTNGYKSRCKICLAIDSRIRVYGDLEPRRRSGKSADKVMAAISRRVYNVRRKEIMAAFKSSRTCKKCHTIKDVDSFQFMDINRTRGPKYSKYCNGCRGGLSVADYRAVSKKKRQLDRVKTVLDNINVDHTEHCGFIYLLRCDELNCFKIGMTTYNPFTYAEVKSKDYGLSMRLVAFISSPIRAYDLERYIRSFVVDTKVRHVKPCGGIAHELFDCSMHKILNLFRSITDKMYLEPNPFISIEDLQAKSITIEDIQDMDVRRRLRRGANFSSFGK